MFENLQRLILMALNSNGNCKQFFRLAKFADIPDLKKFGDGLYQLSKITNLRKEKN